jgi:hypothetical protein
MTVVSALALRALLVFAALMGSGLAERSAAREILVVLGAWISVLAIVMLGRKRSPREVATIRCLRHPKLATTTFHPARQSAKNASATCDPT